MQQVKPFHLNRSDSLPDRTPLPLRHPRALLATSVLLGWAVDWFFAGKPLGISLLLFVLLLVGVKLGWGYAERRGPAWRNLWLLAPLIFFAAMVFLRANAFLTFLNVTAVVALLTYLAYFFSGGRMSRLSLPGLGLVPVRTGLHSLMQPVPLLQESIDARTLQHKGRKHIAPVVRGLLLALPILVIFTVLLTAADLIFASYLAQLWQLNIFQHISDGIEHGLVIAIASWLLAGAMVFALTFRANGAGEPSGLEDWIEDLPRRFAIGFTETGMVLMLVNGLFAAFVLVQFAYLFGGAGQLEQHGLTYAEYARRGFFELVTVAVLTLVLVLVLNWCTRRENKRQLRLFNVLSTTLGGLVLVMLASAWYRMRLYETAYGFTELRLLVSIFIVWLGATLLWFVVTLWKRPSGFAVGLFCCAIGFLVTLNLLNPDVFIVRHNLARYRETGDLDAAYLTTLSYDAVPDLLRALPLVAGDRQQVATPGCDYRWRVDETASLEASCTATPGEIINENLALRYETLLESSDWRQWQSTHLSRQRAWHQLAQWQD